MGSFLISILILCVGAVTANSAINPQDGYQGNQNIVLLNQFMKHANELATGSKVASNSSICWRSTYGRGVGIPIFTCDNGLEQNGLLCYPRCEDNYQGVGPVCWENCRDGFTDEGALCGKDGSITSADNSKCPWYDVCGLVSAKGCSTCPTFNDTSITVHNDGCTCRIDPIVYAKSSYGRGAGVPLGCGSLQYDFGLCYPYCRSNFSNVGPVCWATCPASLPHEEGALCCENHQVCDTKVDDLAKAVLTTLAEAVIAGSDINQVLAALKSAIETAIGFILPICETI